MRPEYTFPRPKAALQQVLVTGGGGGGGGGREWVRRRGERAWKIAGAKEDSFENFRTQNKGSYVNLGP
jgi:hypothetical protein